MATWKSLKRLLGMLAVTAMVQGCQLLPGHKSDTNKIHKNGKVPCQIVSTWKPEVLHVADPARQGLSSPGLAGRLYLFGAEVDTPMAAEGNLYIDLYDLGQGGPVPPVHLENWHLDPVTLKRLKKKDPVGEGYTLFLPWATYRPDISRIQLKIRYETGAEYPLYADTGPLTLAAAPAFMQTSNMFVPGTPGAPQLAPVAPGGPAPGATVPGLPAPRALPSNGPSLPVQPSPIAPMSAKTTRLSIEPIDRNPPRAETIGATETAAPASVAPAGPKVWNLR
jgi:hypothetical protein